MNNEKKKKISKHLSYILRHNPDAIGLTLDPKGWAIIAELISKSPKISHHDQIKRIVEENDKQRFIISDDEKRIRANQGHSINIDLGLSPVPPPEILYHGTATRFLDSIQTQGLKKMSRQHVHLSGDIETATKVGRRHGKLALLEIAAQSMSDDGYTFFKSANGVWLTDHVPLQYLSGL